MGGTENPVTRQDRSNCLLCPLTFMRPPRWLTSKAVRGRTLPCPALKPGDFATVSRVEDCPPGGHRLPPAFWA